MIRSERQTQSCPLGELEDKYDGACYLNPRNAVFRGELALTFRPIGPALRSLNFGNLLINSGQRILQKQFVTRVFCGLDIAQEPRPSQK